MARDLLDLLWRDHPDAPRRGTRGPQAKITTSRAVDAAITLADTDGLDAVTVRRLAAHLGVTAMALYPHIGSRDDLLVLMADAVHGRHAGPAADADDGWRDRVRRVAAADLALYTAHPWLLEVTDPRLALGPGTIAKYDRDLHAFDGTGLSDVDRDAAGTFVADFVRASARARRSAAAAVDMADLWGAWQDRLAAYVGEAYPLARRVGAAAGEAMNTSYSPDAAWAFGLDRVLDALATRMDAAPPPR